MNSSFLVRTDTDTLTSRFVVDNFHYVNKFEVETFF